MARRIHAYTLLYSRLAHYLNSDHIEALLMSADKLEQLRQYDLATEVYRAVPRTSPVYYAAELGRAEALRLSGDAEAAVRGDQCTGYGIPGSVGDPHHAGRHACGVWVSISAAAKPMTGPLPFWGPENPNHWLVYFARGITQKSGRTAGSRPRMTCAGHCVCRQISRRS